MNACLNNLRSLRLVVMMTVLMWTSATWAFVNETFNVDVIMYKVTSENPTKEVTVHLYDGEMQTCDLVIPATVTHNDVVYSVTSISASAFQDCSALTSVTIPYGVKTIDKNAFKDCTKLKGITIPKGVTTIGQGAFNGCGLLEWVSIGKDVTSIARDAFKGCVKVEKVFCYADPALLSWSDYNCDDFKTDGSTKCLVKEADLASVKAKWSTGNASADVNVTFTEGLGLFRDGTYKYRIIDESEYTVAIYGYVGEKLEGDFDIPRTVSHDYLAHMRYSDFSVISIDNAAFAGCLGMTSITIPQGVTSIGDYAFDGCADLTSVKIGEDVVNIGKDAFYCCENVTEVKCDADPDKLTWNEDGCNDFKADGSTVCYVKDTKKWKEKFGGIVNVTFKMGFDAVFEKDGLLFALNSNKDNTVNLESYADPNNPPSEIVVPATVEYDGEEYTVTKIAVGAFYECTTLATVSFAEKSKVAEINASAFHGCKNLSSVTFPAGLKNIQEGAFYECTKLESITLPDGFEGFGEGVFMGSGLKSINLPKNLKIVQNFLFAMCTLLEDITLPDGITAIGEGSFYMCSGLKSISLPANLEIIDDGAFYGCTSLSSIGFPNKLTHIGQEAFNNCTGLTELIIPSSVKFIKSDAFLGCTNVTDVYCYADPAQLEWKDDECNDFKGGKATVCHVAADKLAEFEAKWNTGNASTDLNVTFKTVLSGDANNDGKVNADDIKAVVDYIITGKTAGFNLGNADLNGDGKVDVADLVLLINKMK